MTYNLPEVRPALCRPWASVDGKPPSPDQVWDELCQRILLRGTQNTPQTDADAEEIKSWRAARQAFAERWGNVACGLMMRCLVRECIEESQPAMKTERRDLFAWQDLLTLERRNTSALKCGHCSAIKPLKGSHHDNLHACARTDTTRSTHPASRPSGRTSPSTATASRSHI
jgi:hypothetical protein